MCVYNLIIVVTPALFLYGFGNSSFLQKLPTLPFLFSLNLLCNSIDGIPPFVTINWNKD